MVSPVLTHWKYHSIALNHRCLFPIWLLCSMSSCSIYIFNIFGPPFCWRVQVHFLQWYILYFESYLTEVCSPRSNSIHNKSAFVQIMAWHRKDCKPLPGTMMPSSLMYCMHQCVMHRVLDKISEIYRGNIFKCNHLNEYVLKSHKR